MAPASTGLVAWELSPVRGDRTDPDRRAGGARRAAHVRDHPVHRRAPQLQNQVADSLDQIKSWLIHAAAAEDEQIQGSDNIISSIKTNQSAITSGAITTAAPSARCSQLFADLLHLIFFLYDGRGIWGFLMRGVPERFGAPGRRRRGGGVSVRLVSFVRATAAVGPRRRRRHRIVLQIVGVPL